MNKKTISTIVVIVAALIAASLFAFNNEKPKILIENQNNQIQDQPEQPQNLQSLEDNGEIEKQSDKQKEPADPQGGNESGAAGNDNGTKNVGDPENNEEKETKGNNLIMANLILWGFTPTSSRKIDTVIIHSSYDALGNDPFDVDGILEEYKMYGVSAHYLIDREGNVLQLVKDNDIAYHAGKSSVPDGRTNVNDFSIGIEMVNTEEDKMTSAQYGSLNELLDILAGKYEIKYILGHDEIAPERKTDPWNFDWDKIETR